MKNSKLYYVHCMSPVHIGTGQGVGIIDMPIMRERVTEWPLIPGSSMKGVQREYFKQSGRSAAWLDAAFGKPGDDNGNAGSFVMSDSRLLAFPVASRYGTFAYVTCPLAIKRLIRDAVAAGLPVSVLDWDELEGEEGLGNSRNDEEHVIVGPLSKVVHNKSVYIDEFKCITVEHQSFGQWVKWLSEQLFADKTSRQVLMERLVLVSDDAFQHFVTMCCEIVPRIRILPEKKTTDSGALWYEEYLPAESILYGIVWCDKIHGPSGSLSQQQLFDALSGEMSLQIGANATVGKGRIRCRFSWKGAV